MLSLAALVPILGVLGCVSTPVTIPVLRPAELDVAGLQRIAVLDFQGAAPYAEQARAELSMAIAAAGRCDAPPPQVVREMLPASVPYRGQPTDMHLVIEQARRAGFDGVLAGDVNCRSDAHKEFIVGDPRIETSVETQLIDVHTGRVCGETTARRKWRGKLSQHERAENSERKVTEKLVGDCVAEIARKMETTTVQVEVKLAPPGDGDDEAAMRAGREAAEQGDWTLAAQHFEMAKDANPNSHAARHNLGLACEAQFKFAAAGHWYAQALRLHEAEEYRNALARVDSSWRHYDLAMSQLQRRNRSRF